MAKIYYSLSGEGRGHATRVRAIVESLRRDHEIVIYAPGYAYDLLAPVYHETNVEVRFIPGLSFYYNENKRLDYFRTGCGFFRYLADFPSIIRRILNDIEREDPELAITDFEPALPRAAAKSGLPFISLNHQHFLVTYDMNDLSEELKRKVRFMSCVVRAYYSGQIDTVVSSFFFPPLKKGYEDVVQSGVMLRPEIVNADTYNGKHLVAYVRRFSSESVMRSLRKAGCRVKIYGLGARPSEGNLRFHDVDVFRFVEDLASSRGLVCTAGNQLVGEALYLGKPVLAMPEEGNYEQYINAHYLEKSGAGEAVEMNRITPGRLRHFMDRLDLFRSRIDRNRLYGNPSALSAIRRRLPHSQPAYVPADATVTAEEVTV